MKFEFQLGKGGTALFTFSEAGNLLLTATENGQVYKLEFLDALFAEKQMNVREEETYVAPVLNKDALFEVKDNTLLATAKTSKGVTVMSRFTVDSESPVILLDTWAEGKLYDCGIYAGRTFVDMSGFDKIGGKKLPYMLDLAPTAPYYAFREYMKLAGEGRTLKIGGGFVWHQGKVKDARTPGTAFEHFGLVDAHAYSGDSFQDDMSYFNAQNPLRTQYVFGDAPIVKKPYAAPAGNLTATGSLVAGKLEIPYVVTETGAGFICGGKAYPMVAMMAKKIATGEKVYFDTLSGWDKVTVADNTFTFLNNAGLGFKLAADLIGEENRIAWTVEAINTSADYTIYWCNYPRLHHATGESWDLFYPIGGGAVEKNFNCTDCFKIGSYPGGLSYPMAYYAIYPSDGNGTGIYYGIHDPDGGYKDFTACSTSVGGQMRLNSKFAAINIGEPSNGFALPGKAVWQAFDGDWYDAAEIYRQYIETKCDWMPKAPRTDIPEWMQDIPFWIMDWLPMDSGELPVSLRTGAEITANSWYEVPIKLREEVGVPIGYHMYNWHNNPFNNDFPHFLPPRPIMKPGVEKLQKAGIRVMPYINILLWDTHDKGSEDYQFTSVAKPSAVKMSNGEIRTHTYGSFEPNGEIVKLAPMCPTSEMWRNKLKEIVTCLFNDYNMDAIYLDQMAAYVPNACMDKSHNHLPGGGGWWQKEYRKTMDMLNAVKPEGRAYTSEGNAEVYASCLDGFLAWAWIIVENYVPAFMHIYGGKIPSLGRNANGYMQSNDPYWKYHLAQSLVAGEQMGWINSNFTNNPVRLNYARKLIQFRYYNRLFFREARALRPPVVECDDSHKFASGIGMGHPGVLYQPYITVGVLENGNKRMLIAVNGNTETTTDVIRFKAEELCIPENVTVKGEGQAKRLSVDRMELTIPADSLLALEWEV